MSKSQQQTNYPERITDAFLVLMLTVFLFCFDGQGYLTIDTAKWAVFRILAWGYVCCTLLVRLEMRLISQRKDTLQSFSTSQWLMAAYLLITVLSALCSPYLKMALFGNGRHEGAVTIGLYVLCFLLVSIHGRPKRWMLHLLAVVVLLQSIICIVQLYGGNPLGLYPEGVNFFDAGIKYSGEYLGTIGNTDFVGAFFALAVPLLGFGLIRTKGKMRLLYIPALLAALFMVLKMRVLSCIVGIAAGTALALPVVLPVRLEIRRAVALAEAGCVVAALAVLFFVPFGGGMLGDVHAALHGNVPRSIDSGRLYIWRSVLERVPKHLLLGTGPDTMCLSDIKPFERVDEAAKTVYIGRIDAAHNEYLNVLYHQGIFALVAYLGGLMCLAWRWFQRAQQDAAAAILGAAALSYAIQAFFNISMFMTAPFFWLVLGLLEARCRVDKIMKGEKRKA